MTTTDDQWPEFVTVKEVGREPETGPRHGFVQFAVPGDEMAFAGPVIAAAGLPGGVTAVNILLLMRETDSRERMVQAERVIAQVRPDWIGAAEQAVTALCPGWTAAYWVHTGQWRGRRTDGSGYWPGDSLRAYAVRAPSALCLLARVEQQALLDIAEEHRWLVWPSGSAWHAVPAEDTADDISCLLSAGTAAALAVAIGRQAGDFRNTARAEAAGG